MIALLTISLWFTVEAWLEVPVIALKNGAHPDYVKLNKQEHFRSAVLAALTIAGALIYPIITGQWFIIPAVIINRRIFFDWALIVRRDRPRHKYEGDDWWANFFRRIFGANGRFKEHVAEIVWSVACITLHIIYSRDPL